MKVLITGGSGFIGTHLVEYMLERGHSVLNLDVVPPQIEAHRQFWSKCDILDLDKLKQQFSNFSPNWIIHLAARTDMNGTTIEDYRSNSEGTRCMLDAIQSMPSIQRVIITSSQFVHQPGPFPEGDDDYDPHTIYGQSKVQAEKYTKEARLNCTWTIIRPTNIWGPWHPRYPLEFWSVLRRGLYVHPVTQPPVIRCYGYVKTIVWQINQILTLPSDLVHQQVFYVSDAPVELLTWVDAFSIRLTGKKARRVPAVLVRLLGLVGDFLARMKIKFPITTSRYHSMTENYVVPLDKTFSILGTPPYNLEEGVDNTVQWLMSYKEFKDHA